MMRRRLAFVCAQLGILASSLMAATGMAHAATWRVDDDRKQCPTAQFTTISAAVAASAPGDTILVCPGLYKESVTINKAGLKVIGTLDPSSAVVRAKVTPNKKRDAIVEPPSGAAGFSVVADDVLVQSFVVWHATNNAGIYTSPLFSGYRIWNNDLRENSIGLYFNSSGDNLSQAQHNLFLRNNTPGAGAGNGVYTDQGLNFADIDSNRFIDHDNAGILLASVPGVTATFDLMVTNNRSRDENTFVALFETDFVSISGNRILNSKPDPNGGSAIFIGEGSGGILVAQNLISRANYSGVAVRSIDPFGTTVRANCISRSGNNGIDVTGAAPGAFFVTENWSTENRNNGIYFGPDTSGNDIDSNTALRNGAFDCRDDSLGGGTGDTANFWTDNRGRTDNRGGTLCSPRNPGAGVCPFHHSTHDHGDEHHGHGDGDDEDDDDDFDDHGHHGHGHGHGGHDDD